MMIRASAALLGSALIAQAVPAEGPSWPSEFKSQMVDVPGGATLYLRWGGSGPAVVLLHGFAESGDMWRALAVRLATRHTVIVPDLRGMGRSSHPTEGYDKWSQAADIREVVESLGFDRVAVVGHDIGNMVAYAYTLRYRGKVERLVVMDAPIPGMADWEQTSHLPRVWHYYFYGPDVERLVQGRERIYLDRFWNEFSAHPDRIDEATRAHYAALYALPGAMHAAFAQFQAFPRDAQDNQQATGATKLDIPVLAVGGARSYGAKMAEIMRHVATSVRGEVVPDSGHWLMNENPTATISLIDAFLNESPIPLSHE